LADAAGDIMSTALERCVERTLAPSSNADACPFADQPLRRRQSRARRASRDDRYLALTFALLFVLVHSVHNAHIVDRQVQNAYIGGMARPRSFDEEKVLRAARDQFWTLGYAATSLDDLTAATGLGKGSLYGAFGSKRELSLRVVDEYCARAVEDVRKALAGPDDSAARRLRAFVLAEARARASDPKRRGCLLAKATAELAEQDEAVAKRALATFRSIEDQIAACVAGAQRHGDLDDRIAPRRLGRALLATLRGLEALGKAGIAEAALMEIAQTAIDGLHFGKAKGSSRAWRAR
jgi:AcrR family transcriptional regulator